MNSEIVDALKILGYSIGESLPSLSELRKAFFNSARAYHSSKNPKAER